MMLGLGNHLVDLLRQLRCNWPRICGWRSQPHKGCLLAMLAASFQGELVCIQAIVGKAFTQLEMLALNQ